MDSKGNNKSKVVATIDVNIQWPTKRDWLEESVDDHLNCVLCGGAMNFSHKTDFIAGKVSEEAHCPSCHVKNRNSEYVLQ
ncbi:MAG TPA: hypothetical protein PKC28_04185 [Bdellovibrionales bacterium]|nr:hypothetical protein [Bdellovibrionales bacterium]